MKNNIAKQKKTGIAYREIEKVLPKERIVENVLLGEKRPKALDFLVPASWGQL